MTDKGTVVLDSDDDINIGLVISDVKSLADEVHLDDQSSSFKSNLSLVQVNLENESNIPFMQNSELVSSHNKSPSSLFHLPKGNGNSTEVSIDVIPDIQECLSSWKTVFPWVQYKKSNKLICELCQWGFNFQEYHEVLQFHNVNDKFSVAAKLRLHAKKKFHIIAKEEQALTLKVCEEFYCLIKNEIFKIKSIEDFFHWVSVFSSDQIPQNTSLIPLFVQNLAVVIEEENLESLFASPYFSVIAFGKMNFMILRWLTPQNEVVEHYFSNFIQKTEEKLPILAYLQYRGLDMSRMVSFSDVIDPPKEFIKKAILAVNVANRLCSVDTLLMWLSKTECLQDIFLHLEAVLTLCHLTAFPPRMKQLHLMESFGVSEVYKALRVEGLLYNILTNVVYLDRMLHQFSSIHGFQGLDFQRLSMRKDSPLIETLFFLPKLSEIVEDVDSPYCLEDLRKLRTTIVTNKRVKKKGAKGIHDEKENLVVTVIDMFICQAILTKQSQTLTKFPYIDILSKEMRDISVKEFESVFSAFMPSLGNGKGLEQLQQLQNLFHENENDSPLKILSMLQSCPAYHQKYGELLRLGQMIMVIPALNAHVERYAFEITATEFFLSQKFPKELEPLITYLNIEGQHEFSGLNRGKIFKVFSGE
ncbi:uncharacterized protein LOC135196233 isoform X1 [Macrobrachium nipponense]|uniref:uncharacterized protein LOC135196233 isoform X1 n=1 Tax=Macrobrachium nipponense TaxID=159736 RepID=UPI0030C7B2A4